MLETYRWDDDSYTALDIAGVPWQAVTYVLYDAHPRIRRHTGVAALTVSAPTQDGRWLAVALIEEHDDQYLVVGAHWMSDTETEIARRMTTGGQ
ncbi:MAG TPA: hypothetical protein VF462_02020 [Micromonosporaceae bacterium]